MNNNYNFTEWIIEDLVKSGIPLEVANRLGFEPVRNDSGYKIPYRFGDSEKDIFGDNDAPFYRIKNKPGTKKKYWQPPGSGIRPYIIPEAWEYYHLNPKATVYITEGEKKAVTASINGFPVISIGGIWNWGDNSAKGYVHWSIGKLLKGHLKVIMIYDSDGINKPIFKQCAQLLARALIPLNIRLYKAFVPAISDREKTGLDDWLTANNFNTIEIKEYIDMNKIEVKSADPWNIPRNEKIINMFGLSFNEFKVLSIICGRQKSGWCNSAKTQIAHCAGISESTVDRVITKYNGKLILKKHPDARQCKDLKVTHKFRDALKSTCEQNRLIENIDSQVQTGSFKELPENKPAHLPIDTKSIEPVYETGSNANQPILPQTGSNAESLLSSNRFMSHNMCMEKEKSISINLNKELFIKFPNLATSDKRFIPDFELSPEETDSLVLMLKLGSMTQAALYDSKDTSFRRDCNCCNMSWASEFLFCPNCYFNLMRICRTSIAA